MLSISHKQIGGASNETGILLALPAEAIRVKQDFPKRKWIGYFHRQVRVQFDYPVFSIAVTADIVNSVYEDCRIFVVGTYGKFTRMTKLESYLKEKNIAAISREEMMRLMDFEFRDKPFCSGEYLKKLASEQLINAINNINGNRV